MATPVDQKLLRQTKFPPEFNQKVDMKKVNVEVMKKWIAGKISEILGSEDDVVIELCFNLLEGSRFPDIKALQISLTGFLDKDTPKFCKELWNLCLSAQSNAQGVPKELLEAKKLELIQEKIDAEKAAVEAKNKRDHEQAQERDIDSIRQRERAERGRGRRGAGGRGGRGYDTRPPRYSRSPPRRRRSPYRGHPSRREADTYVSLSFHFSLAFLTTFSSCWPICVQVKLKIQNQVQVQVEVGTIFTEPFTSTQERTQFKEQESDQVTPTDGLRQAEKNFRVTR
ncbi:PWI domain-containing protein [Fonsecaea pedrosoi]|nr:PWI domain-containing protein [Fonsecaea pedrosoi]